MTTTNKDTKVITGEIRLSYAHLFTPYAHEAGQEEKYSTAILIPKSDKKTLTAIKKAVDAAKEAGKSKWGGKIPANLKTPLRDGDEERPDQPEYAGHYFLNASSKTKPGVVDKHLNPIMDSEEVYSGCYARVSINFYAFNTAGNKGVACGLNNVQKLRDGDYLGGRSRAEDDFDVVDDGEEDDFLG
ncbi:DUF2815 family protein [Halalkalibacterium halodurans]|uniref:DUF2815 family protein n=1 Tax=Halalkalibacterium halodurans TaxID=86665 RepID=UPI002E1A62D5|nr:DUF2815 family protein [Halalkalibacterium halodurans]MED4082040.1 DUF2815 family protein [Halalkalibacterium halodurans]MED4086615.1 DUF2815 family protein [Halalkalibacterium halodurans]MED4104523.1 DUF2815 family protein [Halalkalibacterium halodurans]MED4110117.1 DUF2815 family protein [Halalkalibacterium halodurans]